MIENEAGDEEVKRMAAEIEAKVEETTTVRADLEVLEEERTAALAQKRESQRGMKARHRRFHRPYCHHCVMPCVRLMATLRQRCRERDTNSLL